MPARPASPDTITAAPSASPLPPADPAEPSVQDVIAWYDAHARDLPWRRRGTTPWEVLVSEVMSQQTPVARVVPAWQEWMRRWPGPTELSQAPTSEVLRVWGRLGYPRRALRLIECARSVVEQHDGVLPDDLDALLALPGVGEYTAGAVLAFAHGRRALVLDTNVRRVLARAVGGQALPAPSLNRAERERALHLLPDDDATAAHWSVSVMELGALVCTAREPDCDACPWRSDCAWLAAGRPADVHAGRRRSQAWHGPTARPVAWSWLACGRPLTDSLSTPVSSWPAPPGRDCAPVVASPIPISPYEPCPRSWSTDSSPPTTTASPTGSRNRMPPLPGELADSPWGSCPRPGRRARNHSDCDEGLWLGAPPGRGAHGTEPVAPVES
ncbi:hypothetical protein [Actinomyces naeslundii]|uniref:hypothetical protein n=1 Tax=Actinomyces naeslundii TaxID=1655 RepID=UPI00209319BC|nr:hypothetical protein [Actinomyces naeslundii]